MAVGGRLKGELCIAAAIHLVRSTSHNDLGHLPIDLFRSLSHLGWNIHKDKRAPVVSSASFTTTGSPCPFTTLCMLQILTKSAFGLV
jgi:hypothetical protein